MTDYVAFVGEEPISVEEYRDEEHRGNIKCICGSNIHFVNESCFFERKGKEIQRIKHFCHPKGSKCIIPKDIKDRKKNDIIDDKPELTLKDKRLKRIKKLIIKHHQDLKTLINNKEKLKEIINIAKKNEIEYEEEIEKQNLFKFYEGSYFYNIKNYEYISFKNLANIQIEPNKIYKFNEIDYSYILKKRGNYIEDFLYISSSSMNKIIEDYKLYCEYLKQLSLIIIYYSSRCDKENIDTISLNLINLERIINEKIFQKKIEFIND
jgi:hypothetical protein